MAKQEMSKLAQEVERKLSDVTTFGLSDEEHFQQLARLVTEARTSSYIGKVAFAGQRSSGSFSVQFNADGGSGYSSTWPEWAFNQANSALLNGKKLWVIADGPPFGSNLLTVLVLSTSV
jgi:hypothetical protein